MCQNGGPAASRGIRKQDGPRTLFYLDPPYLATAYTAATVYRHEMSTNQHAALLGMLANVQGRFLLNGYRSELYDRHADKHGWTRHDFELPNNAAGGTSQRTMVESIWTNFVVETRDA